MKQSVSHYIIFICACGQLLIIIDLYCLFVHVRKSVKEKWDHKKSLKQNLKSLDLVYSANELLPIAAPEAVLMVRNHGYCIF